MGTLLHRAEPGLALCMEIKALSVRIEELTRDFFGERASLPDLRRASLLWGSEAEEVRAPLPPCCFSVRGGSWQRILLLNTYLYATLGGIFVFVPVFSKLFAPNEPKQQ